MPNRPRPRVHARDHEHGGADPHLIHYEDVGEAGSGGQSFFTAEYHQTFAAADSTNELLFEDAAGFYTNDSASFSLDGAGRVNILQAGGYHLLASAKIGDFLTETDATAQIQQIRGIDAGAHSDYGVVDEPPISAFVDKSLLPGSGGYVPTMQYPNFMNLQDDYAWNGTRPVAWPLVLHVTLAWTLDDDHNVRYSLVGTRYA